MIRRTDDLRIRDVRPLIPPAILSEEIPISERASNVVSDARAAITAVIEGRDPRLVVVVGPCSIHDTVAALDYAARLQPIAARLADSLIVVMRTYFEKPRTVVGWKGSDQRPRSRRSFHINKAAPGAAAVARDQRSGTADRLGVSRHPDPAAHRRPDVVGGDRRADRRKPGPSRARVGSVDAGRLQEQHRWQHPDRRRRGAGGALAHWFPSVTKQGVSAIFHTVGNDTCHVILRGGTRTGPNYDAEHVARVGARLASKGLRESVMVDCSHGNSLKDHQKQGAVAEAVSAQIADGSRRIFGAMLEEPPDRGPAGLCPGRASV
jgi:3-deoxy-7-phosphoheptulonate synthase